MCMAQFVLSSGLSMAMNLQLHLIRLRPSAEASLAFHSKLNGPTRTAWIVYTLSSPSYSSHEAQVINGHSVQYSENRMTFLQFPALFRPTVPMIRPDCGGNMTGRGTGLASLACSPSSEFRSHYTTPLSHCQALSPWILPGYSCYPPYSFPYSLRILLRFPSDFLEISLGYSDSREPGHPWLGRWLLGWVPLVPRKYIYM